MESKELVMGQAIMEYLARANMQCLGRQFTSSARSAFDRLALRVASLALISLACLPALAVGLNDTGITACGDASSFSQALCASVAGDGGSYPRQDARFGRDARATSGQLSKIGGGGTGFDFSKIDSTGAVMPLNATQWDCIRDNVTGLTWEIKTVSGLRSQSHTYSWYQSNVGSANHGVCENAGQCDTEKFVAAVNASALCSYTDWRMPTVKELQGIVNFGRYNPTIDVNYFPNTPTTGDTIWWTATRGALIGYSWFVNFGNGGATTDAVASGHRVRLVRGAL